jgi:alpha-beta hydrolase superfamily lysophospholipase
MPPTIFMVPGLWEGPASFEPLKNVLNSHGFETFATSLKSTGTKAPGNPTMSDDLAGIRADLENAVEGAGSQGVIVVAHSAGGFLGCSAMEGLTAPAWKLAGKEGGILKIVLIASGVAPEGHDQFGGPFIVEQVSVTLVYGDRYVKPCSRLLRFGNRMMDLLFASTRSTVFSTTWPQKRQMHGRVKSKSNPA